MIQTVLLVIGTFLLCLVAAPLAGTFAARLYLRVILNRRDKEFRKWWPTRPKAKIDKIGEILVGPDGKEHPANFVLSAEASDGVLPISRGPDGELAIAGYTEAELMEMVRRRSEFEFQETEK